MGHNFHDMNGVLLAGLDLHVGIQFVPFLFGPVTFLELNAIHPFTMGPGPNEKVHINGVYSVKDQHEPVLLWPHLPFVPHIFNLVFPLDMAFGVQRTWIPRLSVLAEGKPMSVTLFPGMASMNLDCFLFTKAPVSAVHQVGTVETTPSLTDFAYGIGRAVVNAVVDAIFYAISGPARRFGIRNPTLGNYASVFLGNLVGRISPFGWTPRDGVNPLQWGTAIWGLNATGISPQSLIGGLLDAAGVPPPGTQGLQWADIVGPAVGAAEPADGQQSADFQQVVNNITGTLFPPLKYFRDREAP
jgi:hypothetical protein